MSKYLIKEETLTDIADAIREKTGDEEPIQVSDFASEIDSIETGGEELDWTLIGYSGMPQSIIDGYNYALQIKNSWNNVTNMNSIYKSDKQLVFFPVVDVSNVSKVGSAFYECIGLMDAGNLSFTNKVTSFSSMFANCYSLVHVKFDNIDMSNATTLTNMFSGCTSLKELDLSDFENTSTLKNTTYMFSGCTSLNKIDMRKFDFTTLTNTTGMFSSVPTTCLIIVKNETQKTWFNTNFSSYTNVQTVAEYEAS